MLAIGAVTAIGVAAVTAFEVVGGGEYQVGAFVVEVFRGEFGRGDGRIGAYGLGLGGLRFVFHY